MLQAQTTVTQFMNGCDTKSIEAAKVLAEYITELATTRHEAAEIALSLMTAARKDKKVTARLIQRSCLCVMTLERLHAAVISRQYSAALVKKLKVGIIRLIVGNIACYAVTRKKDFHVVAENAILPPPEDHHASQNAP